MSITKRFYIISIIILAVLSAYPLINGVRMAYLSVANGAIEPEQYAKYVAPYTAICVSVLLFAALQPLYMKLKRFVFPVGIAITFGVFVAVELFFESMQIHVSGMTLINVPTLTQDTAMQSAPVDLWQAASCVVSPIVRDRSLTYTFQDRLVYIMADGTYKIHYYLISLLLITMVCALIYSIARVLRAKNSIQAVRYKQNGQTDVIIEGAAEKANNTPVDTPMKPLYLRGVSTAALLALCVFANTSSFFRQPTTIQTPLASILTGLFFVILGTSAGVYTGSYLLKKGKLLGTWLPMLVSICAAIIMYAGEAAMMRGNVYRFGFGWFFRRLPGVALAPVDILIIILSGAATLLILYTSRRLRKWPGKRSVIAIVAVCLAIAITGPIVAAASSGSMVGDAGNTDDDMLGCYVFDANLYTNPLSSFMPFGSLPYIYGLGEDTFIIADTGSGVVRKYYAEHYNTPVGADEFSSVGTGFPFGITPSLTSFEQRYLIAIIYGDSGAEYSIYRLDNEIWLVAPGTNTSIWSIYRLKKTGSTTMDDLERVFALQGGETLFEPIYNTMLPQEPWQRESTHALPVYHENQMTLRDVYDLARKGSALTIDDFEPYHYMLTGERFAVRTYEIAGADVLYITIGQDGGLASADLLSRRVADPSLTIDLRNGFDAVAQYLNPLYNHRKIEIADMRNGVWDFEQELFYDDDYFGSGCRYYLSTTNTDRIYVVFEDGERMTIGRALEEARVNVEMLVAAGLSNVRMIPKDNPLGGEFPVLHNLHTFSLNGEAFYPSGSFMYVVYGDHFSVYYDIDELVQILEAYKHDEAIDNLRRVIGRDDVTIIAGRNYIRDLKLAGAGIESEVGWEVSSHTPVSFWYQATTD